MSEEIANKWRSAGFLGGIDRTLSEYSRMELEGKVAIGLQNEAAYLLRNSKDDEEMNNLLLKVTNDLLVRLISDIEIVDTPAFVRNNKAYVVLSTNFLYKLKNSDFENPTPEKIDTIVSSLYNDLLLRKLGNGVNLTLVLYTTIIPMRINAGTHGLCFRGCFI